MSVPLLSVYIALALLAVTFGVMLGAAALALSRATHPIPAVEDSNHD